MIAESLVVIDAFEEYNSNILSSSYRHKNVSFLIYNTSKTATVIKPAVYFWFTDKDGDIVCKSKVSTPVLQPLDNVILYTIAEISKAHNKNGLKLHYILECDELKENYIAPRQDDFDLTLEGKYDKFNHLYYVGSLTNHYLIPTECEVLLMLQKDGKTVAVKSNYVGVVSVNATETTNFSAPLDFPEHDKAYIGVRFPSPNKRF